MLPIQAHGYRKRPEVKKLINKTEDIVKEALAGMEALHPELLRVDYENQIIVRADAPVRGKVGLVSGGGSGHGCFRQDTDRVLQGAE